MLPDEEDDLEKIMDDMLKSRGVEGKAAPLTLIKHLSSQNSSNVDYNVSLNNKTSINELLSL